MPKKKREFDNNVSEQKASILSRWKSGESVTQIAKDSQVSRDTIYRWVKNIDIQASQKSTRKRNLIDESTRQRILECFFILKNPSIPHLKRTLDSYFHLLLSETQLRRLLKKWSLNQYRPSPFHDLLIREQFERAVSLKKVSDEGRVAEIAPEWVEDSLPREV